MPGAARSVRAGEARPLRRAERNTGAKRKRSSPTPGPPRRAQAARRVTHALTAAEHDVRGPEPRAAKRARRTANFPHHAGASREPKDGVRKAVALAQGFEFDEDDYIRKKALRDFFYVRRRDRSETAQN